MYRFSHFIDISFRCVYVIDIWKFDREVMCRFAKPSPPKGARGSIPLTSANNSRVSERLKVPVRKTGGA